MLLTSCEYDSRVIESAPSFGGAGRPEKRVTARSKLPQKKCTGLHFPMNPARNFVKTSFENAIVRQKRSA